MNIKKVDDKPMVIHTKEKPKLKVKGAPETHRGEMKEKPHMTELRTEPRRAGGGKNRKSGSP